MPIEIIGTFSHRDSSESHPAPIGQIDTDFIRTLTQSFERNGFDRILIAQAASWPDGIVFASHLAAFTEKLKLMIAHRPGFIAPTMAARMFATLDGVSDGRVGVHIISAPSDTETQADGDFLTRDERHLRSGEYIALMQRVWRGETFDHDGTFFRFRGAHSAVTPLQEEGIPIFFGGLSENALTVAGNHADIYAFGVDTLDNSRTLIDRVRSEAVRAGREIDFCMSTRIILGETEEAAWDKAAEVLEQVTASVANLDRRGLAISTLGKAERIEAMAAEGLLLDERLWIGINKATRFQKAATTLVGTSEQVSDALMRYHALGVRRFLISGYSLLDDIVEFGQTLNPLLREKAEVAHIQA